MPGMGGAPDSAGPRTRPRRDGERRTPIGAGERDRSRSMTRGGGGASPAGSDGPPPAASDRTAIGGPRTVGCWPAFRTGCPAPRCGSSRATSGPGGRRPGDRRHRPCRAAERCPVRRAGLHRGRGRGRPRAPRPGCSCPWTRVAASGDRSRWPGAPPPWGTPGRWAADRLPILPGRTPVADGGRCWPSQGRRPEAAERGPAPRPPRPFMHARPRCRPGLRPPPSSPSALRRAGGPPGEAFSRRPRRSARSRPRCRTGVRPCPRPNVRAARGRRRGRPAGRRRR
jgi:hypothetical protein